MLSGRRLDLLDPSPMDIEIEDIAHGLARVARWNGQTIGEHGFSVAQHSVIVEELVAHLEPGVEPRWRLAALLHDASEYVIGDMISPFKAALGVSYKDFEDRLETAIHIRFGLPPRAPAAIKALIKRADRVSAFYEATQLAGFSVAEALEFFGTPPAGYTPAILPLAPAEAQARYVTRFHTLSQAAGFEVRARRLSHRMSDGAQVVIGLSAVVIAIRDGEAVVLTVRPPDPRTDRASSLVGLPFGSFDPEAHRTFELALRAFVTAQTRFDLGYVEQLYTFGDKGRDAPRAELGTGAARVVSIGHLALTPSAVDTEAPDTDWAPWSRFFPWEDWREGRPEILDRDIGPALMAWAERDGAKRLPRVRQLFALDGAVWNEERVLDRYELLYESGLAPEAARDLSRALGGAPDEPRALSPAFGEPMLSDHRRILATGLGRLRGKLKYRPVIFLLMPQEFTLSALQRAVEGVSGVPLHKQNFRRVVERTGLVEGLGRLDVETGGRPAELFRFRREALTEGATSGLSLPLLRD